MGRGLLRAFAWWVMTISGFCLKYVHFVFTGHPLDTLKVRQQALNHKSILFTVQDCVKQVTRTINGVNMEYFDSTPHLLIGWAQVPNARPLIPCLHRWRHQRHLLWSVHPYSWQLQQQPRHGQLQAPLRVHCGLRGWGSSAVTGGACGPGQGQTPGRSGWDDVRRLSWSSWMTLSLQESTGGPGTVWEVSSDRREWGAATGDWEYRASEMWRHQESILSFIIGEELLMWSWHLVLLLVSVYLTADWSIDDINNWFLVPWQPRRFLLADQDQSELTDVWRRAKILPTFNRTYP